MTGSQIIERPDGPREWWKNGVFKRREYPAKE